MRGCRLLLGSNAILKSKALNLNFGSKKRLFGDNGTRIQATTLFNSLLSNAKAKALLQVL